MTDTLEVPAAVPIHINGVSLYTRAGKPRQSFGERDRFRLLGPFKPELEAFVKLFARRRKPYIHRRLGSGWRTVHHFLAQDEVVKHLLADRLPGVAPIWIGTRAWETTMHAAIDIDFRGDQEDFKRRCEQAEKVLLGLGISRQRMLICPSPSGGRHYRFFFRERVFTSQLRDIIEMAGLPLTPGQFEVFPSETQGFRLPFGYIPGKVHDPTEWVRFIRAYMDGTFPRVSWGQLAKRAENRQQRRARAASRSAVIENASPGEERHPECGTSQHTPKPAQESNGKAIGKAPWNPRDSSITRKAAAKEIDEIWNTGITGEGTRVALTKKLAWHLIFIERLSIDQASLKLIDWVYRTGRLTSRTVREDLMRATRKAQQQTIDILKWCDQKRQQSPLRPRKRFASQELDCIVDKVMELPPDIRAIRARFGLDFLNFAKRCGKRAGTGYECQPSVEGVIKKWENCRGGTKYKANMDWAVAAGLIQMTRNKSQRARRPRTYTVFTPVVPYEEWTLTYADALDYLRNCLVSEEDRSVPEVRQLEDVGYKELVSLEQRENSGQARDRLSTEVEESVLNYCSLLAKPLPSGTTHPDPTFAGPTHVNNRHSSTVLPSHRHRRSSNPSGATAPEYQHQGRPCADLATCPPTGPGRQPTLQDMDNRPPRKLPALPPDKPPDNPGADGDEDGACAECPRKGLATGQGECYCLGPYPEDFRYQSPGHPHGPSPEHGKPSTPQTDVNLDVNFGQEHCFHIGPAKPILPTQSDYSSSLTALSIGQLATQFPRLPLSPGTDRSQPSSHRPIPVPITANWPVSTDRLPAYQLIPPNLQALAREPVVPSETR